MPGAARAAVLPPVLRPPARHSESEHYQKKYSCLRQRELSLNALERDCIKAYELKLTNCAAWSVAHQRATLDLTLILLRSTSEQKTFRALFINLLCARSLRPSSSSCSSMPEHSLATRQRRPYRRH
jgi:hypothetical protein